MPGEKVWGQMVGSPGGALRLVPIGGSAAKRPAKLVVLCEGPASQLRCTFRFLQTVPFAWDLHQQASTYDGSVVVLVECTPGRVWVS